MVPTGKLDWNTSVTETVSGTVSERPVIVNSKNPNGNATSVGLPAVGRVDSSTALKLENSPLLVVAVTIPVPLAGCVSSLLLRTVTVTVPVSVREPSETV